MNGTYVRFHGPDGVSDGCLACQYELEQIGPLHGPGMPSEWQLARNRYEQSVRMFVVSESALIYESCSNNY